MNQKTEIRSKFSIIRKSMSEDEVKNLSNIISINSSSFISNHKNKLKISLYHPINNEADITNIRQEFGDSFAFLLPHLNEKQELYFSNWNNNLTKKHFNILQPIECDYVHPDIIFMPLIACDLEGNRVGYGKGHFDKALAKLEKLPILVGVCYHWQIVEFVEKESHDISLDYIISEQGIFSCNS